MQMKNILNRAFKAFLILGSSFGLLNSSSVDAACGRVDIAPTYVHIDVLQSGKTVHKMDISAFRGEAAVLLVDGYGFVLKPYVLCGTGDGDVLTTSLAFGHCTPVCEGLILTPNVGCGYTYLRTHIDFKLPTPQGIVVLEDLKETFRSCSPFLGLDISYDISDCWKIYASYQYVWSRTKTEIESLGKDRSHSSGSNYGLSLERSITECFSVNVGAAYNNSLSKEKHGLRGYGVKLGLAYWY